MKIFHIDMNSFFASCEQAANPELMGKPVIVAGDPQKRAGIVLAASYEAKAFGIKTTMLIGEAQRRCPDAVFLPGNYHLYKDMSRKVMAIFDDYTPLKEQASIDEAFLDMTGTEYMLGDSLNAAKTIQSRIHEELNIGCSIGISTNKLLAKMASDMKKPMGITELYPQNVPDKMWPMEVGKLFGIGKKSAERLNSIGIKTIGDLAKSDENELHRIFGSSSSAYMINSANGYGSDKLIPLSEHKAQSISNELTYPHDLTDTHEIEKELLFLSDTVAYRLRKNGLKAKCVTIKIKYGDFKLVTRSVTVENPFDSTDSLFKIAKNLFLKNWTKKGVRLLGVGLSHFGSDTQMSLFGSTEEVTSKTDDAVDAIREKYGYTSISRGSLMGRKHKRD